MPRPALQTGRSVSRTKGVVLVLSIAQEPPNCKS
nr:MAG TPA: hypothetical protein [Caudoviricetes sp.]DAO47043.1 MAG TPA: hypothetical protein [Caudoviricetes sp.]